MATTKKPMKKEPVKAISKDEIAEVETGECPSLSGLSTITYAIGKGGDGAAHVRLVANSGKGMFCKDWVSAKAVNALLSSGKPLTSRSVQSLHPGRSINTGGFLLAVLRHLELVRISPSNSRNHEPTGKKLG